MTPSVAAGRPTGPDAANAGTSATGTSATGTSAAGTSGVGPSAGPSGVGTSDAGTSAGPTSGSPSPSFAQVLADLGRAANPTGSGEHDQGQDGSKDSGDDETSQRGSASKAATSRRADRAPQSRTPSAASVPAAGLLSVTPGMPGDTTGRPRSDGETSQDTSTDTTTMSVAASRSASAPGSPSGLRSLSARSSMTLGGDPGHQAGGGPGSDVDRVGGTTAAVTGVPAITGRPSSAGLLTGSGHDATASTATATATAGGQAAVALSASAAHRSSGNGSSSPTSAAKSTAAPSSAAQQPTSSWGSTAALLGDSGQQSAQMSRTGSPQMSALAPSTSPSDAVTRRTVATNSTVLSGGDIAALAGRAVVPTAGDRALAPSFELGPLGTDGGADGTAFMAANRNLAATISQPRQLGDGSYQLRAALTPAALGHVDATVKADGANVEVTLVAHTAAGHQQLSANLDQLRRELGTGGGQVAVTLSDGRRQPGRDPSSGGQPSAPDDGEDPSPLPTRTLTTTLPGVGDRSLHVIL